MNAFMNLSHKKLFDVCACPRSVFVVKSRFLLLAGHRLREERYLSL